jgi:MFS family permease
LNVPWQTPNICRLPHRHFAQAKLQAQHVFQVSQRGRALSFTALGTSFGGLFLPYVFQLLIDAEGWRTACAWIALICMVISLPPILLWVKDRPRDLGLTPDGEALPHVAMTSTAATGAAAPAAVDRLFSHGPFWRIALAVGAMFSAYTALLANLVPYALGQGIASGQAALLISTIAMAGIVGKLLFSVIADRANLKWALLIAMGMVGVPLLMLVLVQSGEYAIMLACAVAVGLAAGGLMPAWGALLARIYGPLNYGRVMGRMQPVTVLMVMVVTPLCGYLFDRNGNYSLAFLMLVALLAITALVLAPMRHDQGA